jgi:kynureninase
LTRISEANLAQAAELDRTDNLSHSRDRFHLPVGEDGNPLIYLCGNSLGLQPRKAADLVDEMMEDWRRYGVEGHFKARRSWMPYHRYLTESLARLVGGLESEVVAMNSLTVNLHLLMISFYRPTPARYKILIEAGAFPSDRYAVASQARFHGFDPDVAVIEIGKPINGDQIESIPTADILRSIEEAGDSLAMVLLGGVNYLTGQLFEMERIAEAAHKVGAMVGYDLAHAAGNIPLRLHDWNVDFAAWCSYKYLNAGPGSIGGAFIHSNHHKTGLPRFEGWWGHDQSTRFLMPEEFRPVPTAEAWQLSNPPILPLAALRASLDIFDEIGIERLREKSIRLTGYMEQLLIAARIPGLKIITQSVPEARGAQLSLLVPGGRSVYERLTSLGVISDWREPSVIRVAPVPLYNSFTDVFHFVNALKSASVP